MGVILNNTTFHPQLFTTDSFDSSLGDKARPSLKTKTKTKKKKKPKWIDLEAEQSLGDYSNKPFLHF